MTELRDKIASAVATTQNVPFVGPKQLRIADAILPLIREAKAEALDDAAAFLKPTGVVWYGDGGVTVYADGAYGGNRMDLIDWLNSRAAAYRVGEGQ